MSDGVRNKVILITGGCGDIGRAVIKKLADHDATVIINDLLDESEAKNRLAYLNLPKERSLYIQADVTDRAQVDRMIEGIYRQHHRLDVACSNAGMVEGIPFLEYTEQKWNRILAINLTGCFHVGQAAAKAMIARNHPGQVIFTTSWVADVPWPEITPYCVSKSGLKMLMKSMARELTSKGVRVNAVSPGIVNAGMARHQYDTDPSYRARADKVIPMGFMQPLESVAEAFLYLCSDAASYMTGSTLLVDGGCSLFQFD
jgi:NAD(P)-dependent dehydrogenase (short-subunit alcohol dehydrogenase family)